MRSKEWVFSHFQTLNAYIEEHGTPWTVGANRGEIDAVTAQIIIARRGSSRLAVPLCRDDYVAEVRATFSAVALSEYWNIKTTYAQRDAVLGNSGDRVTTRTGYAAPDGSPDTAYSTGMEKVTDTAPMHENVDRALTVQDGWKDAEMEAAAAFDTCFLGVIA